MDWGFLRTTLEGFDFHLVMVDRIMRCVSSTSFSLSINGGMYGYFNGKRGLRQGDPLSPYLFTMVKEVLTLLIRKKVANSSTFKYHAKCDKLGIVNLCFVDDLFLFAHGVLDSTRVLHYALINSRRFRFWFLVFRRVLPSSVMFPIMLIRVFLVSCFLKKVFCWLDTLGFPLFLRTF